MRLTINGEQVNYSLDDEKTLGEVMQGVRDWLSGSGFVIGGVCADGQELLETPGSIWGPQPIAGIGEIDVRALHTADARIENWQTFHAWLGMLAEELVAPGASLKELLASVPETLEGIYANPFLPADSDDLARLSALFNGQDEQSVRKWPPKGREDAMRLLAGIQEKCARRIQEASRPQEALHRCIEKLSATRASLSEVSVQLQTGRDKQAMQTVISFTYDVQELLSLVPFLPPDPARERQFSELTPFLRDLVAAFDSKDSILIGDLLEYEIAPRLDTLLPLFERLP